MLNKVIQRFSPVIYVQIWETRIRIFDVKSGKVFDEKPFMLLEKNQKGEEIVKAVGNSAETLVSSNQRLVNPFSHPRSLLANFLIAEKILQHGIYSLIGKFRLQPSPTLIVHPMEKLDGGLTEIEDRALRELAIGAGAYKVVIYIGQTLVGDQLLQKNLHLIE